MMKITLELKRRSPLLEKLFFKVLAEIRTNPEFYQFFHKQPVALRMDYFISMIHRAQARGELRADLDATLILYQLAGPRLYSMTQVSRNRTSSIPRAWERLDHFFRLSKRQRRAAGVPSHSGDVEECH